MGLSYCGTVWLWRGLLAMSAVLVSLPLSAQSDEMVLRPVIAESEVPVETLAPDSAESVAWEAFLRRPPGEGPFPAVMLVHGGAPRWPTGTLRDFILHTHASRFLEAGYVVVAITRRELDLDLSPDETQPSVEDTIAAYDHVRALPYVDDDSVVVRGTSVGGYLTLEVAAARELPAIAVEEPFSFPFVGISVGSGERSVDTAKVDSIKAPVLLIRGDQTPSINNFNRNIFIPALEKSGVELTVRTYPGQLHSFAFYDNKERTPDPAPSLQAFRDIERFFRQHVKVQPVPLEAGFVDHEPAEE